MALVSDIQLQSSAVKQWNIDASNEFSAEGLTATTAFAVTDGGQNTTVTPLGLITAQSENDISAYFNTTNTDGDVNLYLNNDENPYWNLKLSATAGTADSFMIANACGTDGTAEYPAFSISPAGAVGIGKTGASSILDVTYANSSSGGLLLTESTNNVVTKAISLATCSVMGASSSHKLGFITNDTTRGTFDTSGNFGIGTEAPGALLDVRGSVIFNEAGGDNDVRMEGDDEPYLFMLDASTDRIGIGTVTPCCVLHVQGGGCFTSAIIMNGFTSCSNSNIYNTSCNSNSELHVGRSTTEDMYIQTVLCADETPAASQTISYVTFTSRTASTEADAAEFRFLPDGSTRLTIDDGGIEVTGMICATGAIYTSGATSPIGWGVCEGLMNSGGDKPMLVGPTNIYVIIDVNDTTTNSLFAVAKDTSDPGTFTELFRVQENGRVGIGVTSPAMMLDVQPAARSTAYDASDWETWSDVHVKNPHNSTAGQTPATGISFVVDAGTSTNGAVGIAAVANTSGCDYETELAFIIRPDGAASCEAIRIDSDGEVGIGTATPASLLHAQGTVQVGVDDTGYDVKFFGATTGCYFLWDESEDDLLINGNIDMVTLGNRIDLDTDNDTSIRASADDVITFESGTKDILDVFYNGDSNMCLNGICTGSHVFLKLITPASSTANTGIIFQQGDGGGSANNMSYEQSYSGSCGYLRLRSMDTDGSSTDADIFRVTDGTQDFEFLGSVGIGTAAPSKLLHVFGGQALFEACCTGDYSININNTCSTALGGAQVILQVADLNAGDPFIQFSVVNVGSWRAGIDNSDSDKFKISCTLWGSEFVIDTSGRVGIGTTSPQSSLHVAGDNDTGTIAITSSLPAVNCWNGIEFGYATTRKAGIFFERTCNNYVGKLHFATENTQDASEVALSDAKMTINEAGLVGIGTATPNESLTLEAGVVSIKEVATPTATTNYGKVYTKTDNKLYFQDGAGTEHEIAYATDSFIVTE